MYTTQVEEILKLLQIIADSSMANKIAFISMLVSGIALVSSIYFNHQTEVQYIESLSPLLSFSLAKKGGSLYLTVTNTGQSEAVDINITFEELKNNGSQNAFKIDEVFKNAMTLYPNEIIAGCISGSGKNIVTTIAPLVRLHVSYKKGNTKEREEYSRWVCYSGNIDKNIGENSQLEKKLESISERLNEISYSNNRMANYFEGRYFLKMDKISAYPASNLYQDVKDAVNNIERNGEKRSGRDETGQLLDIQYRE